LIGGNIQDPQVIYLASGQIRRTFGGSSDFLGDPAPTPVFSLRSARCLGWSSVTAVELTYLASGQVCRGVWGARPRERRFKRRPYKSHTNAHRSFCSGGLGACPKEMRVRQVRRTFGGSSDFLGDPPPDPRFLASLGALSWVELHYCCGVDLFGVWAGLPGGLGARPRERRFKRRPYKSHTNGHRSLDPLRGSGGLPPGKREFNEAIRRPYEGPQALGPAPGVWGLAPRQRAFNDDQRRRICKPRDI
jgi:hypothetical protein